MQTNKINKEIFDVLLRNAVKDDAQREIEQTEAMPPFVASTEFEHRMSTLISRAKLEDRMRRFGRSLRVAAVIVAIGLSLTFAGMMTAEAFRIKVWNAFSEVFDQFSSMSTRSNEENVSVHFSENSLTLKYLPQGYTLDVHRSVGGLETLRYKDESGDILEIAWGSIETHSSLFYNTEGLIETPLEVNGIVAHLYVDGGAQRRSILVWSTEKYTLRIAARLSEQEMTRVAEGIFFN